MKYNIYMEKVDKNLTPIPMTRKNLEKDFAGLKYFSMKGINDIGKAKNVYKETYADSDSIRTYVPDVITNESTKLVLTLYFLGENKQDVFDAFNDYIRGGRTKYWDDVRKKRLFFIVEDAVEPSEDVFKNGIPYIKAEYKLTNIYGKTVKTDTL